MGYKLINFSDRKNVKKIISFMLDQNEALTLSMVNDKIREELSNLYVSNLVLDLKNLELYKVIDIYCDLLNDIPNFYKFEYNNLDDANKHLRLKFYSKYRIRIFKDKESIYIINRNTDNSYQLTVDSNLSYQFSSYETDIDAISESTDENASEGLFLNSVKIDTIDNYYQKLSEQSTFNSLNNFDYIEMVMLSELVKNHPDSRAILEEKIPNLNLMLSNVNNLDSNVVSSILNRISDLETSRLDYEARITELDSKLSALRNS